MIPLRRAEGDSAKVRLPRDRRDIKFQDIGKYVNTFGPEVKQKGLVQG